MAIINVNSVAKLYPKKIQALGGITFSVAAGEIVGLLGPNGAGKSTLLRVLTTLTTPTEGEASVLGKDVRSRAAAIRQGIGYVPQSSNFGDVETPSNTIDFYSALFNVPRRQRAERRTALLRQFGLDETASRAVRTLSGGMKRRVQLAAALVHRPSLLILDEPTAGLDPRSRMEFWASVVRLRDEFGTTILFTTHYTDEAERYSDRALIIDKGKVVAEGTPDYLKAQSHGDRIVIRLTEPVEADSVRDALAPVPTVEAIVVKDGLLNVRVAEARFDAWKVLDALSLANYSILSMEIHRPSLDDVYLRATGQTFGMAEQAAASPRLVGAGT